MLKNRATAGLAIVNVLLVGAAYLFLGRQPQAAIGVTPPPPTAAPTATATPAPLRVYVSGAVRQAQVYLLPPGSIVQDAVAAAGPSAEADCELLNLARPLQDGEHIYVPRQGETPPPTEPPPSPSQTIGPVNVNTATADQMDTLPGIGPALAQRIITHRPYSHVDDLLRVPGIGPATLEKIRPLVTVESR